jgi:hypothetical protein
MKTGVFAFVFEGLGVQVTENMLVVRGPQKAASDERQRTASELRSNGRSKPGGTPHPLPLGYWQVVDSIVVIRYRKSGITLLRSA